MLCSTVDAGTGWTHGGQGAAAQGGKGIAVWGLSIAWVGGERDEGCVDLLDIHESMRVIPVDDK